VVDGDSPTKSGLRLLPMMAGLLVASIGTGQLITRFGRYKIYPIVGSVFMALGLGLLSRIDEKTSGVVLGVDMAVFGFGLGLTMQVLIIAVQNAVDYSDLGTATSGATYFRSIGGSFGASIFGTILANRLKSNISGALANGTLSPRFPVAKIVGSPTAVRSLPADVAAPFLHLYAISVNHMFLYAVPVALVAFVLALFLREVPLRGATRTPDLGESSGLPTFRTSLDEIERAITQLSSRQNITDRYQACIDKAGIDISTRQAYTLFRLCHAGPITDEEASRRTGRPVPDIREKLDAVIDLGYATRDQEGRISLTTTGRQVVDQLSSARTEILQEQLADWAPEQHEELLSMLKHLADNTLDAPSRALSR
jgi:DNA-binding MarR family transcriptional regulator